MVDNASVPIKISTKSPISLRAQTPTLSHDSRRVKRRCIGLYRPQTRITYNISTPKVSTQYQSSISRLERHVLFIKLISRRNKNQFRNQHFFHCLGLLDRSLQRLLDIITQLVNVSATKGTKSDEVRRKFERESQLRRHKELVEGHLREVLIPRCYVLFSALAGDSQFANLGVMLMALLAEIAAGADGVGLPSMRLEEGILRRPIDLDVTEATVDNNGKSISMEEPQMMVLGTSTIRTGEDQGEVVERRYGRNGELNGVSTSEETLKIHKLDEVQMQGNEANMEAASGLEMKLESDVEVTHMTASNEQRTKLLSGPCKPGKNKRLKTKKNTIDSLFSGII